MESEGVIDGLAWHAATGSLLIVELKTEIVDINDLMASMDRRMRLARGIAAERGWRASSVSCWVAIADSRTNRRRVARHAAVLRAKFPDDGRRLAGWLRQPSDSVRSLGFLSVAHVTSAGGTVSGDRRVRHARDSADLAGFRAL